MQNSPKGKNMKSQKKKKKFRPIHFWLKFSIILAILMTSIIIFALSDFFNIKSIVVEGTKIYSSEDIKFISSIALNENGFKQIGINPISILAFRFSNSENALKNKFSYIKSVKVRFILPSIVKISIIERKPIAIVKYNQKQLLIDEEGNVLEVLYDYNSKRIFISGLKLSGYRVGQKLFSNKNEYFENALKIIEMVKTVDKKSSNKLFGQITSIEVGNLNHSKVILDERIIVDLGGLQDLEYRIDITKEIYENNIDENEKGILDFTVGENPIFIPESED
jgi:cell division protein FtsQ